MAKKLVEETLTSNYELESDEAFPEKEPKTYKFKLQNGTILEEGIILNEQELWEFVEYLRNQFYTEESSTNREIMDIPPVVYYKGMEIQIDNIPLVSYLSYSQSAHKSIGEIITNVLANKRVMELYKNPDTEEEFSDFVDSSEFDSMTSFEQKMYLAELQAQEELSVRFQNVSVNRQPMSQATQPKSSIPEQVESVSQSTDQVKNSPPEEA